METRNFYFFSTERERERDGSNLQSRPPPPVMYLAFWHPTKPCQRAALSPPSLRLFFDIGILEGRCSSRGRFEEA